MTVLNLADYRKGTPYVAGEARCLTCAHTWTATAPVGTTGLDCPSCTATTGVFLHPARYDADQWQCNCGCDVFAIYRNSSGPFLACYRCGAIQNF